MLRRLPLWLIPCTAACGTAAGVDVRGDAGVADEETGAADTGPDARDGGDVSAELETGRRDEAGELEVDAPQLLEAGAPCADDAECASALCVTLDLAASARVCSAPCTTDRDCPNAFRCVTAGTGADGLRLCLPTELCVDGDGDGYGVGPGCDGPDCDDAYAARHFGADEICDGADNDCDEDVDERTLEAGEDCASGFPGVCGPGRTECVAGLVVCSAVAAARDERCDLADDDCDGLVDEGPSGAPLQLGCYTGPAGTEGIGACRAGAEVCVDGTYRSCTGQIGPSVERCDGVDNDCDGTGDNLLVDVGLACDTGSTGVCADGLTTCEGGVLACTPRRTPVAESCDGTDEDCDGAVDEESDGAPLTQPCYDGDLALLGVGVCASGTATCEDGAFGACAGQVLPSTESCDDRDEDCDGTSDDGAAPAGSCDSGALGACAAGTWVCAAGGLLACVPALAPAAERCDGVDNDCDGALDEDDDGTPLARSCYTGDSALIGVGVCAAGVQTCEEGTFGLCIGQVLPSAEACNGANDDCDGEGADEGDPGGGFECLTGAPGVCARGRTRCAGAIVCDALEAPSAEVCDNADNDCDTVTDEADGGGPLTRACYEGAAGTEGVGLCRAGAQSCGSGSWGGCSGQILPAAETCNGANDDCDPAGADEGCPTALVVSGDASGAQYGGGGGGAFSDTCGPGEVLVGIDGRSAARLDQIQGICGSVSLVQDAGSSPYRYSVSVTVSRALPAHGGEGGGPFSYRCPSGQVITGVFGREGAEIDAFGVTCSTLAISGTPGAFGVTTTVNASSPQFGGSGGGTFSYACPGGGVARGLLGRTGARVDGIGARCGALALTLR